MALRAATLRATMPPPPHASTSTNHCHTPSSAAGWQGAGEGFITTADLRLDLVGLRSGGRQLTNEEVDEIVRRADEQGAGQVHILVASEVVEKALMEKDAEEVKKEKDKVARRRRRSQEVAKVGQQEREPKQETSGMSHELKQKTLEAAERYDRRGR